MGDCLSNQAPRQPHRSHQHPQPQLIHINYSAPQIPEGSAKMPAITKKTEQQNLAHTSQKLSPILYPVFPKEIINPSSNTIMKAHIFPVHGQFIDVKVPKNLNEWTEFQWVKEPKYNFSQQILTLTAPILQTRSFQEKYFSFRSQLEGKRINWDVGKPDILKVDRQNLLMSSAQQFNKINFYREVKIVFEDEKEATDAGGLLREWMNLSINEIFGGELGLLKLCDTSETFYKFNFSQNVQDLFIAAANILGTVIGKAIFEKIPLKCPLNYTILRQLCGQPVQINDIYSYDKDFYRGWCYLLNNSFITMMQQNFCVFEFDEHGSQITVPLKEGGFDIMVKSDNKQEYVSLMIQYYCTKRIQKVLTALKNSFYRIVPAYLLSIFQPHQLQMIICGKSTIDVADWKANTVYTDCGKNDPIIRWFWEYLQELPQSKLQNLLHFVTGNGRVPISGFKYLESNRGSYQHFHIKIVPYDESFPFPKSHTCFNRLQIPRYPQKFLFFKYIEYATTPNTHFGIE